MNADAEVANEMIQGLAHELKVGGVPLMTIAAAMSVVIRGIMASEFPQQGARRLMADRIADFYTTGVMEPPTEEEWFAVAKLAPRG